MLNLPHEGVQITSSSHIQIYKLIKDVLSEIGAAVEVSSYREREPNKAARIEIKGFYVVLTQMQRPPKSEPLLTSRQFLQHSQFQNIYFVAESFDEFLKRLKKSATQEAE